ncbi:MAG: hypothetical protein WCG84_04780, partial [Candidatus Moraniibacteriota bacterium]
MFHFETIQGKLQFDSTASQSVTKGEDPNFSLVEFAQSHPVGEYNLALYDVSGARAVETQFNKKEGRFIFEVPFFSIVNKFEIYLTKENTLILSGSLEQFVQCNGNGICEVEKGENMNTCLSDCANGHIKYSQPTIQQLDANKGVIIDPKTGEAILRDMRSVQSQTSSTNSAQPITASSGNSTQQIALIVAAVA